jgi:midasin (ATPase involved in ribosome maturation)
MKELHFFETLGTAHPRAQCHIPEDLKLQFYLVLHLPGYWVLLDEINLASAETLECLSGLLEGSTGSVHLLERGDQKPIERHPDFRLFACMNPATDVGKKDLPAGLRNRFV